MEEINHFSHKDHPLKLIDHLETTIKDGGEEKREEICYGCREPITGDSSAYGCVICNYYLHKTCAQLEPTLDHYHHFQHPLALIVVYNANYICDLCDQKLVGGFQYNCSKCIFDLCLKCATAATTLHKAAKVNFEHEGHPRHTLTLQLRPATFLCGACNAKDEDFFYQCNDCTFWIHKTCATLCPNLNLPHHHKHPLLLAYSLPDNFYNFWFFCEFCNKAINRSYWVYHCANCRYFAHIKCALSAAQQPSTQRDDRGTSDNDVEEEVNDLMHFPMSEAFTDPLKLLHSSDKITQDDVDTIKHIIDWTHPDHPLILNTKPQAGYNKMSDDDMEGNDESLIKVCYRCVRSLNSLPYYTCTIDGCSFTLHKYCVDLPYTLKHQLHPDHELHLYRKTTLTSYYKCNGCYSRGNTLFYQCEPCGFYLDVNCAYLPNTIKHISHNHPLSQLIDPKNLCKACNKWGTGISYACKACNFHLGLTCAMKMPHSLSHRFCKGHEISFTIPPIENHPEDFYCDICELEMHPKHPLYHCYQCKNSFHLYCISPINYYANIYKEGTITVSYHNHPLTHVRRKKTAKDVCSKCNRDINGHLILECRASVCNFQICYFCHVNKM